VRGRRSAVLAEREYVLDEYVYLRSWGIAQNDCAARLHLPRESLRYILQKAAERGDPRSDWTPHVVECTGTYESLQVHRERARGWVA